MTCDFFDPITASCAPICVVCSYYQKPCPIRNETTPVLQQQNTKDDRKEVVL